MPFAFVAAMGGVGFEDVAVAGFQLFDYTGLIDRSGTDIVSQRTEKNRVFAIFFRSLRRRASASLSVNGRCCGNRSPGRIL